MEIGFGKTVGHNFRNVSPGNIEGSGTCIKILFASPTMIHPSTVSKFVRRENWLEAKSFRGREQE